MQFCFPDYVTHYYSGTPFQSLTTLSAADREAVLADLSSRKPLPRRLRSEFYFQERLRYELLMREQFLAKGGRPRLQRPHYAILGESEIWSRLTTNALRMPLAEIPAECISFTYTDSWGAYVDRDLDNDLIPRKPQYGTVYRLDELPALFEMYGWPGERWKTEPDWAHDLYVEAQLWLEPALPST